MTGVSPILSDIRVIDLSALGPGPFASMVLADFGAKVLSVRRPGKSTFFDPSVGMRRGKESIGMDLRQPEGVKLIERLSLRADVVLEGARPGVMERLGLGPDRLMSLNERLIYVRLTGWGQTGPYAARAGHDLNYLAVSGALSVSGLDHPSMPPALFGDLANGSYLAVMGILLALYDRRRSGKGQVVDAAITDGAAYTLSAIFGEMASGLFNGRLGHHVLSGAAPFYGVYCCSDGKWFSVAAIEPPFYANFLKIVELTDVNASPDSQWDARAWPALRARVAKLFLKRSRDEWSLLFDPVDACGAPVIEIDELETQSHLAARKVVSRDADGRLAAAPAPRLSSHPDAMQFAVQSPNPLEGYGIAIDEMRWLVDDGVLFLDDE